jgi:hypothetical protein
MNAMRPSVLAVFAFAAACGSQAAPPPASVTATLDDGAWDRLRHALAGSWSMTTRSGADFRVVYRVISNDSALVEDWGVGSRHETETVFYADHRDILLTHYCAQGNQPRLRAVRATPDEIEFRFVDVTNKTPDQAMLVARKLRFAGATFDDIEIYRQTDGSDETTTYHFVRAGD